MWAETAAYLMTISISDYQKKHFSVIFLILYAYLYLDYGLSSYKLS